MIFPLAGACRAGLAAIELDHNTFSDQWSTQLSELSINGVVDTSDGISRVLKASTRRVELTPLTEYSFVFAFMNNARKTFDLRTYVRILIYQKLRCVLCSCHRDVVI